MNNKANSELSTDLSTVDQALPIPSSPARIYKGMRGDWCAKTVWSFPNKPVVDGDEAGEWELQLYTSKGVGGKIGSFWNVRQNLGNGLTRWAIVSDYRSHVATSSASRCTEKTITEAHLAASQLVQAEFARAIAFYAVKQ